MSGTTKNLLRLFKTGMVLAKYDALFFLDDLNMSPLISIPAKAISIKNGNKRKGERLASALQNLGPTFIKFGQALSIRPDIVGDEIAADLSKLQDSLPPFSGKKARGVIEEEFGLPVEKVFKEFDDTPIAAASIAQVHFAVDNNGRKVAVKILRPGIEKKFAAEIEFLYWLAGMAQKAKPGLKRLRLKEVVRTFEKTVKLEMDLRMEASAANELKENMENDGEIKIPTIDWQLTSRSVMTMSRISGIRIDDIEAIKTAGHDADDILKKASGMFFKQVFRDGFFHADMHPGNLFVSKEGQIIAVDFGIMGRIDKQTRIFLAEMLLGFLNRDYQKVADIHFAAGYTPKNQSRELFAQALRSIGEPIFGLPQNEISIAKLLRQLFKVSEDFEMETQPQLLLLQKTMMAAEGLGRKLNPSINFWEVAKPLIEDWGKENLGAEAKIKSAAEEFKLLAGRMSNVMKAADNIHNVITKDGIKLHPDTVKEMKLGGKKGIGLWGVILISVLVSVITVFIALS